MLSPPALALALPVVPRHRPPRPDAPPPASPGGAGGGSGGPLLRFARRVAAGTAARRPATAGRAVAPEATEADLGPRLAESHRHGDDRDRAAVADRLVELTYRRIFGALAKLCDGDTDLAADLTQETYRKAWQSLSSFRADCAFSTWLYRIAFNTFLNARRRPRPVRLVDAGEPGAASDGREDGAGAWHATPVDPAPGADDEIDRRERERALRRAVARLPEPLRFTVTARYWGGLSSPEIAALEAISAVAVRKRLMKALRLLEDWLSAPPPLAPHPEPEPEPEPEKETSR